MTIKKAIRFEWPFHYAVIVSKRIKSNFKKTIGLMD